MFLKKIHKSNMQMAKDLSTKLDTLNQDIQNQAQSFSSAGVEFEVDMDTENVDMDTVDGFQDQLNEQNISGIRDLNDRG